MDPFDEDVSARVLLRNFLHSEQPSSAVTRSESQRTSSELRRSHRLRKSDAGLLSPRGALRKKLGQNLKEKIFIQSPIQRGTRSSLTLSRNVNTPAVALHSPVEDDLTPRGLLRGILQTEPELSLLVPDRPVSVEHGSASSESSLCSNRPSMGMSNLDLPDLPTMNLTAAIRGISRKRPKRNVNVSVFEREMIDLSEDDAGDKERDATGNLSGASASSLTLSLKTPLVDLRTDGRFLQRKVGKRKAISVEAFEQGIDDLPARKRDRAREQSLENITSGLNDTTAYDLDKSSTVLYSQPVSMATMPHAAAFVSMHDRDTVTATQIQREVEGGRVQAADEMEDGEMEEAAEDFDDIDAGVENAEEEAVESVKETEESESEENMEGDELEEEEEAAVESETQEEEVTSGEQVRVVERVSRRAHRSEGVKKIPGMAAGGRGYKSLSYDLQLVDTESKGSAGRAEPGEQEDDTAAEFEREEKQSATSELDREEEVLGMQEGGATESETQEGEEIEGDETEEEEEAAAESETQEEEVTSGEQVRVVERVSRRAHRSEGVMKIPGMAAGGRGYKSLSHGLQLVDTESKGSAGRAEPGEQEDDAAAESEREERQSASFESDREEEELGMQEGGGTESETQEEEVTSAEQVRVAERVSRRAHRSEGVKKITGMAAGGRGYKSLSHGLQLVDTEGGLGWAEPGPSEGAASRVWHSGTEGGSRPMGVSPSRSPRPPSPVSPNEIPPSPESLRSSAGRGLRQVEEHMGGGDHAEEAEDKENSIPLPHLVSPEMSSPPPQTLHTFTGAGPSTGVRSEGEQSEEEEEEADDDDDEEEDDGADSDELSLKTPAFVRQKRRVQTPGHAATPNFLKQIMEARKAPQAGPAAKPKHQRKPQAAPSQEKPGLPKSFIMSTFKHFAKTKVSPVVYPVLKDIMDKYFNRLADDLEAYATHAKRKTIEVQDVELLMRRQGFVTDSMPVNVLIEKYLPHEYRKLLIPMATSGNKVVPKQR